MRTAISFLYFPCFYCIWLPTDTSLTDNKPKQVSELAEEGELRDLFERFGRVTRVFLARDRETQRAKGFAFISFADRDDAARACDKMDGCKLFLHFIHFLFFFFFCVIFVFSIAIVAMSATKQVIGIATNISSSSSRLPSPYPARRIRQACHLDFLLQISNSHIFFFPHFILLLINFFSCFLVFPYVS